jgi:hypothetical protein
MTRLAGGPRHRTPMVPGADAVRVLVRGCFLTGANESEAKEAMK